MLSSSPSLLDSLPARPPTPPRDVSREAVEEAISFLDDAHEVDRLTGRSRTDRELVEAASAITPSSSQEIGGSLLAAKRVGFSPHLRYHKVPLADESSSPRARLMKRSPSKKDAKPVKSILKLSNGPSPPTPDDLDPNRLSYFSPAIPGSFSKMLHSSIQHLASSSRDSRLDAYLVLNGALQAYDDVPDTDAIVQRMGLLMQFLSRDISWKNSDGNLDTNIISQALKLAMALIFNETLSKSLDDDFRMFLVDRSITMTEQQAAPKQILKLHMSLLAQQRFSSSIMTAGKAERTLNALHGIERRCSGNSVVAVRLVIYHRLLDQAPSVMFNRLREWLEHVFHGLLSSIKDVRSRAVETCLQAALVFGQQPLAAKVVQEMLETEAEEGGSYFDYFKERLIRMVGEKEAGSYVPRIWSSIILFFRSKRRPLHRWPMFRAWLTIIQKCLNSSDATIRYEATLAWNKLVFAIMPDSTTPPFLTSLLKTPISSSLDKRGVDGFSKQVRLFALDSYYNLLHYAFRPGLSNDDYDHAWKAFVHPILSEMVKSSGKGRLVACQVLYGLLNGSTGVWNGNAAIETMPIKPEELPKMDPRLVRSRLANILQVMEPMLIPSMWSSPEATACLDEAWTALMQSVADAGNQEVKTSNDLKEAIAQLVNLFRRLWNYCNSSTRREQFDWFMRYINLLLKMLAKVKSTPFTEEVLATTKEDNIEVAPTPSHRSSTHYSAPQAPMVILFRQFRYLPPSLFNDVLLRSSVQGLLKQFISCKTPPSARLELLTKFLQVQSDRSDADMTAISSGHVWMIIARMACKILQKEIDLEPAEGSQSLGHDLRHAVEILQAGLITATRDTYFEVLKELYDAIFAAARTGAGAGGVVLAVMEPCAKGLQTAGPSVSLECKVLFATHLLSTTVWPKTRQTLDHARKALWGVGLAPHKSAVFDPFEHVYTLIVNLMISAYKQYDTQNPEPSKDLLNFVSSAVGFLEECPLPLVATALRRTQAALCVWITDADRKTSANPDISIVVQCTCSSIQQLVRKLPAKGSPLLKLFEPIFVAGLSSTRRAIVNDAILFWNEIFGNEESLEYPPAIESVLRARMEDADIQLPTFPESNEATIPASLPEFFESQSQEPPATNMPKISKALLKDKAKELVVKDQARSVYFTAHKSPWKEQIQTSSSARRAPRSSGSSTPKARLRHDDSQIQFAAVGSSPLAQEDSQLLTEHQREVKTRQQQNAQMFPDLSSSPMAQSTALPRALPKRLDFAADVSRQNEQGNQGTPTALHDPNGLVSDDMPSSPTPSSNRDASQGAVEMDDDQEAEDVPQDPPSSPPRGGDDDEADVVVPAEPQRLIGPDETTVSITDFATTLRPPDITEDEETGDNIHDADMDPKLGLTNEADEMIHASDVPSDSQLPAEQLRLEEEEAAANIGAVDATETSSGEFDKHNTDEPQDAGQAAADIHAEASSNDHMRHGSQSHDAEGEEHGIEITRVENSFIEPDQSNDRPDTQSTGKSSQSPATKKRKRSSSKFHHAKKRKQESPLKRSWDTVSSFLGWSQQQANDDDEDIGEEIVVASSQPAASSLNEEEEQAAPSQPEPQGEPVEEPSAVVKQEPPGMQAPPKRGRGRPRKSETPTPSLAESQPSASLKRRASTVSNASGRESLVSTSFVQDIPAPIKTRKRRRSQDARSAGSSQVAQDSPDTTHVTRRTATAVLVESTNSQAQIDEHADAEEDLEPAEQANRPILTPRSILGRLRDALSDFKGMILGSQEEREFDDVLFELRREVHEAGRRGREL